MSEVEPKARGCSSRKVYLEIPQNSEKLHMCWSLFLKLVLYTLFQMHCPKIILSLRSSHRRCSIENDVLKKFRKFHRKTPVLESLFNKVEGLKKDAPTLVFL